MRRVCKQCSKRSMMMLEPQRRWPIGLALGIAMAVLFALMAGLAPAGSAAMPKSYGSSILALEFARTMPDLRAIFGDGQDPGHIANIAMAQIATWHDMGFALLYPFFLATGALALRQESEWRPLYLVPLLAMVAGLLDLVENWLLLGILETFRSGGFDPMLTRLGWPVWGKFLALGLANSLIGLGLTGLGGAWRPLGFVLAVVGLPLTLLAWIMPQWLAGAMAAGIAISWVTLFALCAAGSWAWWKAR